MLHWTYQSDRYYVTLSVFSSHSTIMLQFCHLFNKLNIINLRVGIVIFTFLLNYFIRATVLNTQESKSFWYELADILSF